LNGQTVIDHAKKRSRVVKEDNYKNIREIKQNPKIKNDNEVNYIEVIFIIL
jgi:hypothetical protein